MSTRLPVTVQINLAPSDFKHSIHLLPHHLELFSGITEKILLVVDLHKSKGRFSDNWEYGKNKLFSLINSLQKEYKELEVIEVDYSKNGEIGQTFFNNSFCPVKDFRGGPYYAYLFGIYSCKSEYIFHVDSDIIFSGDSYKWLSEAILKLEENQDIMSCSPLPGPPHPDKIIYNNQIEDQKEPYSYLFDSFSTRLFLINKAHFIYEMLPLPLEKGNLRSRIKGKVEGNGIYELPENILTNQLRNKSKYRLDFYGEPGFYSLHPPYRNEQFYKELPMLIEKVKNDSVPHEQRGHYDVNSSMIDWSNAIVKIKKNRWWKRILK
ncbi:glycosyltransferase family A protein [Winogradskyella wichelsiae]|uniref:glycosyltransferase family A protein n=1 Tax=Winogradskyella wichelsiae TaxID=2697007 RepID=UPI0015CC46E4|nr:glycosyltransferase family A protein [Winogradskyella wichelsiae]